MRCVLVSLVVLAAITAGVPSARAEGEDRGVIAVLPLVASDKDLAIYSQPVARAVVGSLSKKLGRKVEAVSLSDSLPSRVSLVIDGRIVARGKRLMLTATVRDPARGTRSGTASTREGKLTDVDRLAGELADALVPVVESAAAEQTTARAAGTGGVADPYATPERGAERGSDRGTAAKPQRGGGHKLVVVPPSGTVASGEVSVSGPGARAMWSSAERLGFSPSISDSSGIQPPTDLARELAAAGADHALMMEVRSVSFEWRGVLSARGRVRIVLTDRAGTALHDEIVETDTLIGSRGDRQAALVAFVAEQALDIVYPALRRQLK